VKYPGYVRERASNATAFLAQRTVGDILRLAAQGADVVALVVRNDDGERVEERGQRGAAAEPVTGNRRREMPLEPAACDLRALA
jgi:hypothetical protein